MAPFVIPGIVLAIGFYAAYAPPPLALYGTATILILAYTTRFLPIAYYVERGRHAQHQSRNGGGGAHSRRRAADRDPPRAGAATSSAISPVRGSSCSFRRRANSHPRSSWSGRIPA